MDIKQLKDNRNKLMQDAQKLMLNPTTETRAQFDAIMLDVDALEQDIARAERVDKHEQEQRTAGRPPRAGFEQATTDDRREAEKRAFVDYLKTGRVDRENLETRDLLTSGTAGALIPQDFLPQLIEAQKAWGALTTAVGQKRTNNGEPLKVALTDDVANVSTVIGEGTVSPEVDPAFTGFISNVDFLTTGTIKVSLAELQDSAFDLDTWIRNAFGKRIARGLAQLIVNGSTSGNIQSIITTAATGAITSAAPAALAYTDFVNLYSKLDPAYLGNASWVMNSTTRGALLGQLDGFGRPLFVPSVNTDTLDTILGRPVIISQYHPGLAAGNVAVQFGSLTDGYVLRTAGDVSILRLNERYADTGEVGFIGYHRNGGFATNAGTNPIINLVQHA